MLGFMIRVRRLYGLMTENEKFRFAQVEDLFRKIFILEQDYAPRLREFMENQTARNFEIILLTAENARGTVLAFVFSFYFPELKYAYLDYIGASPGSKGSGLGGALYEALRESLAARRARGLFFEVPPDEPERITDKKRLSSNQARMRFYERFSAFPLLNTKWDNPPERKDYDPPFLVYDGLGRRGGLGRRDVKKMFRRILETRYDYSMDHPSVRTLVDSVKDDPVRLRPPRYEEAGIERIPRHGKYKPLKIVIAENHEIHHVREKGFVERPARVAALRKALSLLPAEQLPLMRAREEHLRSVHDPNFLRFLSQATASLKEKESIYPQIFPVRRPDRKPRDKAMRAGYYCSDNFTPLSREAYAAARSAADCAYTGALALESGDPLVYALCRPPGHHAEKRIYGGFCYLNNAAIAAHYLSRLGPVALLDIDYHHGNGSQEIFYNRRDVFTISIHGHPTEHYPYFAGFADEKGEGEGLNFNKNFPLRGQVGLEEYLRTLEQALRLIRRAGSQRLVLSLGFDIMRGDPTGNFNISPSGMRKIGAMIGSLSLPILIIQEGGYTYRNLRSGALSFFSGLLEAFQR